LTRRHVILVGLPGAGKTTVGRLVAAALDAAFIDLDEAIALRAGKSIPRLFAEDGESVFRTLEAEVGAAAFGGAPQVVAAGGGFFVGDVTRAMARGSGLVVYLETDPAEAAARLGGPAGRPLLEGGEPAARAAVLLAEREAKYLEAECTVATGGRSAAAVAASVVLLARGRGGW
jgi:shikimate kinase